MILEVFPNIQLNCKSSETLQILNLNLTIKSIYVCNYLSNTHKFSENPAQNPLLQHFTSIIVATMWQLHRLFLHLLGLGVKI